jgi:hypothetical protein
MVPISIQIASGLMEFTPEWSNMTSTVTSAVGSTPKITSASWTASPTSAKAVAPELTKVVVVAVVVAVCRDHTSASIPASRRRIAIALPIVPAPRTATRVCWFDAFNVSIVGVLSTGAMRGRIELTIASTRTAAG